MLEHRLMYVSFSKVILYCGLRVVNALVDGTLIHILSKSRVKHIIFHMYSIHELKLELGLCHSMVQHERTRRHRPEYLPWPISVSSDFLLLLHGSIARPSWSSCRYARARAVYRFRNSWNSRKPTRLKNAVRLNTIFIFSF
jgi:hypothetical protein